MPSSHISGGFVVTLSPQYGPSLQSSRHEPYAPEFVFALPSSHCSSRVLMPSPQTFEQTERFFTKPRSVSLKLESSVWRSAWKSAIS